MRRVRRRFGGPFGESQLTDHKEELFKLKQGGSVADYLNEFDQLSTRVSGLSESSLISYFVGGLREDIWLNAKCFQPANLAMTISLAKLHESRVEAKKKLQGSGGMYRSGTVDTPF